MSNAVAVRNDNSSKALSTRFGEKFGVEPSKLMQTLKATAFKQRDGSQISNEQLCALMIVADKYDLNPFVKEIYAYPDKNGGIVPVVGVDGWNHMMNANPNFDGIEFLYSENIIQIDEDAKPCPEWVEARIYLKNRSKPVVVREYLDECYKPAFAKKGTNFKVKGPWQTHPKRFMRHKASSQCARVGLGFCGVYDEDEGKAIINNEPTAAPEMVEAEFVPEPEQKPVQEKPVQEKPKTTRTRKPKQEPKPEPEVEAEYTEVTDSEPEPETEAPPEMVEAKDVDLF